MNIAQISKLGGRGASLLAKMLEVAPLFRAADFKLDASTHLVVADKDSHTSTAARAEGSALQRDAQVPSPVSRNLALYGREISVDDVRKLDSNVGISPAGLRLFADRRLMGLAGKLATEVQDQIFVGSDTSNEMLGVGVFVKDAASGGQTTKLGFTTAELAAMNTNVSLQLNSTDNQYEFIEMLDREIAKVPGANALVVNVNLGARMNTIARKVAALSETRDQFGVPIQTYNGIPIVKVPITTITQTESDGNNSDCTSLWVVRFAEDLGVSIATNSGFYFQDFDEVEAKPNGIARLQFFLNLVCERTDALRRLSRIRL